MVKMIEQTDSWGFIPELFLTDHKKVHPISSVASCTSSHEIAVILRKDRFVPQFFSALIDETKSELKSLNSAINLRIF